MRTLSKDTVTQIGQEVTVKGWVQSRRDHGGLIFIDLRDHTGIVQLTIRPDNIGNFAEAEQLRDEFVISATGMIAERGEGLKNSNIPTGEIEVILNMLSILNRAEPMPIQMHGDQISSEEQRLKYRFLDLRRDKMQTMLKSRAKYHSAMRTYMEQHEFTEVTTPILANSSPEGARDFLIPARLQPGKFYALPQAPQQFKQLLMVGGVSRYYQLATCFRDEDPRADRLYGEFYQLDMEMSFVDDGEEVRTIIEPLIKNLVTSFAGKRLQSEDIPRIPYQEAMNRFGSDKPDLRFGMELIELTDIFADTDFGVFKNAQTIKAICVKSGASLSRKQIDSFTDIAKSEGAGGLAYIIFNTGKADGHVVTKYGTEITAHSPIAKHMSQAELDKIAERMDVNDGDAIFFGADTRDRVNKVLGRLRNEFASHFELKDPDVVALAWIVDFPFYELDEKTNKLDFGHNPFSMPKGGLDALRSDDKASILADQYDMVANGYEISSGGVRNHNPEVLYEAFGVLGYDREYVDARFGGMLNAFKYGAPPHAGCAFGTDRLFMILTNEENIREIVAFPKNGSGMDLMMNSPSVVDDIQLKDLNIKSTEQKTGS